MKDCKHQPSLTEDLEIEMAQAIRFHGHLGPYLVFGLRMGRLARRLLDFDNHFDVKVTAFCGSSTPRSCMADGLQISTGATLGKGRIHLAPVGPEGVGASIEAHGRILDLSLSPLAIDRATGLASWKEAELVGEELLALSDDELFRWKERGI